MILTGKVFGQKVNCPYEKYLYNKDTNAVELPDVDKSTDCLGGIMSDYGLDPDDVQLTYIPGKDQITVDAEVAQINLKQCGKGPFLKHKRHKKIKADEQAKGPMKTKRRRRVLKKEQQRKRQA